nr:hypothetical protein [Tanacetum cinerariifolium]
MSEKMNDPECMAKRVNIIPPNYSKENFLATFTPQTQLTPEQVFWSLDLEKTKAEELKANTPPLRKLAAATVYPPNTPAHLVPRTLPTKWSLKTLVTEVKEMKEIFKSMEAEVDQNAIDLRSGEIERKNLLITNENRIAKCIAHDVFYTVANSALTDSGERKNAVITNENVIPKGYLNRLKDTLDTLCEIVEEARSKRTSDNSLEYACVYTKISQELLENVITSCCKIVNKKDRYNASTHAKRNKHVTFAELLETSPNNTSTHFKQLNEPKTNVPVIPSTRVNSVTKAIRSQPRSNTKIDKTLPAESGHTKNVEAHLRNNNSATVATPRVADPGGSPSSTTIDQNVPSASTSPTTQEIQSQVTHQGAEEQIHGHQNAQFDNAPLLYNLSSDLSSKETTLQGFISSSLHHLNQLFDTLTKLTMNHPLENVICDPS